MKFYTFSILIEIVSPRIGSIKLILAALARATLSHPKDGDFTLDDLNRTGPRPFKKIQNLVLRLCHQYVFWDKPKNHPR
jgi:hypothetical protein